MTAYAPIDSRLLRPRRLWFLAPALIGAAGITVGVTLFFGYVNGTGPKRTFAPGETVTIQLSRDPQPGFFVNEADSLPAPCDAEATDGSPTMAIPYSGTTSVTENGETWYVLSFLSLPADGTYRVTCPRTDTNAGVWYAIGTPPKAAPIVAMVLFPLIGEPLAIAIAIFVIVRREVYRRRMRAAMYGPAYGPR